MSPRWFSARCAFRHGSLPGSSAEAVYEERIVLLRASSAQEAIAKAEQEAETYAAGLGLDFLGYVSVYDLAEAQPGEGVEVYSLMRSCAPDDEGYLDRFMDTGAEHSQDADEAPDFFVREPRAADAPALTALAFAAKASWGYPPELMEAWRAGLEISPELLASRSVRMAEDGEGLAGFYALRPGGAEWILEHLWVAPERQRQGLGRALLEHAKALASASGAGALALDADPHAEPFYRACGAETIGARPAPIPGDAARVLPRMRLSLN